MILLNQDSRFIKSLSARVTPKQLIAARPKSEAFQTHDISSTCCQDSNKLARTRYKPRGSARSIFRGWDLVGCGGTRGKQQCRVRRGDQVGSRKTANNGQGQERYMDIKDSIYFATGSRIMMEEKANSRTKLRLEGMMTLLRWRSQKNESWSTSTGMFDARHRYKLSNLSGRGNSRYGYT